MSRRRSALVLVLLGALLPSVAAAQEPGSNSLPGLSAADQYVESIPSSRGGTVVGNQGNGDPDDPAALAAARRVLPDASLRALRRRGDDGKAAAALAGRTAPRDARPSDVGATSAGVGSGGALDAAARIVTATGDGIGILFPLGLVAGALVVAGPALRRRQEAAR